MRIPDSEQEVKDSVKTKVFDYVVAKTPNILKNIQIQQAKQT